jgi:hypothetical protein
MGRTGKKAHMEYLVVGWQHNLPDMPIEMYSELDGQRMEVRKVEVFKGGNLGYASASVPGMQTKIGIEPVPSLYEIASQPEFKPRVSNAAEFEKMWRLASEKGRLP